MTPSDPLTPPDDPVARADERARQREREAEAIGRLSRVHGAHELQAAILALLMPRGSKRARSVWLDETIDASNAQVIYDDAKALSDATRLPWLEWLLARFAGTPLLTRKALLESTRRLMIARNKTRPIDRLHWLVMRQRLGETPHFGPRTGAGADISQLHESGVLAIATYTAFLARIVPAGEDADVGAAWYTAVMAPWQHRADLPPCVPPEVDALVLALHGLRSLPWLQRPVVVRAWVSNAVRQSRHGRLDPTAADALRLSCTLLDCPLPPDLAQNYSEVIEEPLR